MAVINEYDMIKIYTAVVLSLFDNLKINRRDSNNPYTIPLVFAQKDRLNKRIKENQIKGDLNYSLPLPYMNLELTGIERNLERQTNRLLRTKINDVTEVEELQLQTDDILLLQDNNELIFEQAPNTSAILNWNDTAINIQYTLNLLSKNMTEMMSILEFIISTFKNAVYYVDVKLPLYQQPVSTPIILETTAPEIDNNEDNPNESRLIQTTLEITVKGLVHNNITSTSKKITKAILNQYLINNTEDLSLLKTKYKFLDESDENFYEENGQQFYEENEKIVEETYSISR